MLPYVYRVTTNAPGERDGTAHRTGTEGAEGTDPGHDHGTVEEACLQAIAAFAADSDVGHLTVREPGVPSFAHLGQEQPANAFGLDGLFTTGPGLSGAGSSGAGSTGLSGFHDGAEVPLGVGLELVRVMRRGGGAWCRLEVEGAFAVHVGRDPYLYVSTHRPCERALARTRALGLFPERVDASPHAMEADGEGIQRPGDDDFWARLNWAVLMGSAGLLEERYIEGASRWYRLSRDTLDAVRAGLAPRALLAVWPDLSFDIDAVLDGLPAGGTVEGVWQDKDGRVHSALADEDRFPELAALMSGANGAALLSVDADERVPLFTAVMPDSDGVVRCRRRTEPTPSDRNWAFLRTLRRGEIVTGTVTDIAAFGVYVDIGGFEALVNIPELSWRLIRHPSEVVSVGQEVTALILYVDGSRERVFLSLKALQEDPGLG